MIASLEICPQRVAGFGSPCASLTITSKADGERHFFDFRTANDSLAVKVVDGDIDIIDGRATFQTKVLSR